MFDHKHVYVSLLKTQVSQSKTCKCCLFLQCRLTVLLSILCTSIMKHGYIPSGMLDTTLTPIVKTKTGDVTDKDKFDPLPLLHLCQRLWNS